LKACSGDARPRVLVVSPHSSYRIAPFLAAAERLVAQVVVVSSSEHSLVSALAHGVRVDFRDTEAAFHTVTDALGATPVHGILGTDDASVELAARLAQHYGLPHNPPEAACISRRKDLARARLAATGVTVPRHRRVDLHRPLREQIGGLTFPIVAKPLMLSASRGVIRADDLPGLEIACRRIADIIATEEVHAAEERESILLEEYVPGREYALEGLLDAGELRLLALFDKPDPLEGPFFEETYYITPTSLSDPEQGILLDAVQAACRAYGLVTGPVHAELRLHQGQAWVLEIAARSIGGECARLLRFGTGFSLEELLIAHAIGEALPRSPESEAAGVLMIPIPRAGVLRRVEGLLAAQRVPGIEDIVIAVREGYELVPLPEGASYLGFMFARGPDARTVEQALREAHTHLRFVTVPVWHLGTG
jgi:biotin carboxylase